MGDIAGLWEELARVRGELLRAVNGGGTPVRRAVANLGAWSADVCALPEGAVSAERMAGAWGNLQLLLVECGPDGGPAEQAAGWRHARRAAVEGMQVLLARPEWSSLAYDFRDEVLPLLTDAIARDYAGRVLRCAEVSAHLRWLMLRTSGVPHAWRLRRVAEMQYPYYTAEGWYGRMGIDFTWTRARAVLQALLEVLPPVDAGLPLVVGYDGRIHARELATLAAELAVLQGRPVHLARHATPTPALRHYCLGLSGLNGTAGAINCTAAGLPIKDDGNNRYAGHEFQGLCLLLPAGDAADAALCRRISRRAGELLLERPVAQLPPPAGSVTSFDARSGYEHRLLTEMQEMLLTREGEEEPARTAVQGYWGAPGALVIIDEMYGATRGYLAGICTELGLPYEVLHGEADVLFGELSAANPQPPQLADLITRVKEQREQRGPLIGLAFDAEGTRLGVVDELGNVLPGHAVLALLTDFLLREGYPGEAGLVLRSRTATRALERLVARSEADGRTLPPPGDDGLPAYMHHAGYLRLSGDPHLLHGAGVAVSGELIGTPAELLIGGDGAGSLAFRGRGGGRDGMRAALLLLQLCAVRKSNISNIWEQLQQSIGKTHTDSLTLYAPQMIGRALIDDYIARYRRAGVAQLAVTEYRIGGCRVEFAGGEAERFVEFALRDADELAAYLSISYRPIEGAVCVDAEGGSAEIVRRLLITIAERLDGLFKERLHHAANPWQVMELLAHVTSPLTIKAELPGTLTCRLAAEAYTRLQELARPGREAPELMRFITERLRELRPDNARALAACHLGEPAPDAKPPPIPQVRWESEE